MIKNVIIHDNGRQVCREKIVTSYIERRSWVRLHEKGGKHHEVPAHHNLDAYIEAYIKVAGLQDDPKGLLFRTIAGKTGRLTLLPLSQADAYRMIRNRAKAAGIKTKIGNHTFWATGQPA